MKGQR